MNDLLYTVFICFLAGAGAGIGTGFAGMSAAGIISPLLMTFCGVSPYEAIGIGLASDVLASAASAMTYRKNGNLDIKNALPLLTAVLVMTIAGSYTASLLPERSMGFMSQFGLLVLGLKFMLKPGRKTAEPGEENTKHRMIKAITGGTIVGFICGFVGAGGGMMLLFVLTSFLGYEIHKAVGTSVFIMSFTALIGGVSHFTISGRPDMTCLLLCVFFTLIWSGIASAIANKASEKVLCRSAGIVMFLTSCVVLSINFLRSV